MKARARCPRAMEAVPATLRVLPAYFSVVGGAPTGEERR